MPARHLSPLASGNPYDQTTYTAKDAPHLPALLEGGGDFRWWKRADPWTSNGLSSFLGGVVHLPLSSPANPRSPLSSSLLSPRTTTPATAACLSLLLRLLIAKLKESTGWVHNRVIEQVRVV
ncbi:unnamed protein product [Linum trigynum]|uniref:Uncharacterized protein n=1 Tax=Linum trigynum TaxID=586398 RepID=A0AAV2FAR4_9ROSI